MVRVGRQKSVPLTFWSLALFLICSALLVACAGPASPQSTDGSVAEPTAEQVATSGGTVSTAKVADSKNQPSASPQTSKAQGIVTTPPEAREGPTPALNDSEREYPEPDDPSVVAEVNGTAISLESFDARLAEAQALVVLQPGLDADSEAGRLALRRVEGQVLDWMIDQILIEQAAVEAKVRVTSTMADIQLRHIKGKDAARFSRWLKANGMTEESLRAQVRMDLLTAAMRDAVTKSLGRKSSHVRARHILLSQEDSARAVAEELAAGQNFIVIARQYSEDDATRDSGGDLGFLPRGVMPPELERAAFALQPGQVSPVIRTATGLHILQVVESDPDRTVADDYWPAVQQRAFEDWLAGRRAQAEIKRRSVGLD